MLRVQLPYDDNACLFTGVTEHAVGAICENYLAGQASKSVVVVLDKNLKGLESLAEDIDFLQRALKRDSLAEIKVLPAMGDHENENPKAFELMCDRLGALAALQDYSAKSGKHLIIATTPQALLEPCPPPEDMAKGEIRLEVGMPFDFQDLVNKLTQTLNYDAEALCETPGQFAVRGGLLDIYPLNALFPCRIDFFGNEIESIRKYDPTTQRSEETLSTLVIKPAPAKASTTNADNALSFLPKNVLWIVREPAVLLEQFRPLFQYPENMPTPSANFKHVLDKRQAANDRWVGITALDEDRTLFSAQTKTCDCDTESLESYRTTSLSNKLGVARLESEQDSRAQFLKQLLTWQTAGHSIYLVTKNQAEEERLKAILAEDPTLNQLQATYLQGSINQGFRAGFSKGPWHWDKANPSGVVIATEAEIYGRNRLRIASRKQRRLPEKHRVDQLLDFSELVDGDYLVHLQNGICIFRGIQQIEFKGKTEEVISLEFEDQMTLHLKLHESHLLSRYVGMRKQNPKLGKLGTHIWDKTRAKAEQATLDFAAELLHLQASRETHSGFEFAKDNAWQNDFENAFLFNETKDQLRSINEAKADMEKPHPMDRLICGDVGFGKTEVALRAAFKAVMGGKQVALLIPTTVLAQQHFITFKERMAEFPVVIEMLSRFRSAKQRKTILKELSLGKIDIIIGTHSLLGKTVQFKDLGLLIIDEEHRFGVKHKEQLKHLKKAIDVLTMSATPIPRTLYFALMGARDLSVIETAPRDRLPIQTVVKSYDDTLVKNAIRFEVNRGGQVFYLHNRVQTIDTVAKHLQKMLPDLRIAVGHGQMSERALEKMMTRFVAGEYDVLVSTTIIESGLDIPNSNTIIIEGADRFGLSQLYQLRGRVGRFNRQAYCYLLLHRHARLLDLARKRLGAIRQYNKLGAGFRIAMRDLELRGAGNLLGGKQSGHIAGVGFDLYCQLLRQSIARIKGEKDAIVVRAHVYLDFIIVGEAFEAESKDVAIGYGALKANEAEKERIPRLEAHIPLSYMSESRLRIDFYRKLAMAESTQDVKEIAHAMKDRFGKYPTPVKGLLGMTEIRCLAEQAQIVLVETEGSRLKCRRGTAQSGVFIKVGNRFPRLTAKKPLLRLAEIKKFLKLELHKNP